MVFWEPPTYYHDTTTRYYDVTTSCTQTTNTTTLYIRRYDIYDIYGNLYFTTEPVVYYSNYTAISDYNATPIPPKNWRWYDGFRIWEEPIYKPYKEYANLKLTKHQTRISLQQRHHQKRRQYIQQLHS